MSLELLGAIPGISAHPVGAVVGGLSVDQAASSVGCKGDPQCLADYTGDADFVWVLTSDETTEGKVQLIGAVPGGRTRTNVSLDSTSRNEMWSALHQAIGLAPPSKGPPSASAGKRPTASVGMTPSKVTALSFVPLPGVPAMAQKDWGNVGLAWGVAAPSAALFVLGSAASQETPDFGNPGFLLSAAGGAYLSVVFANQVTGMRAYEKARSTQVGLAPMPVEGGGGAVLTVR